MEPVGRKIQMYSSDVSGASGAVLRPESQYTDTEPRPHSGFSEDGNSVRTVIVSLCKFGVSSFSLEIFVGSGFQRSADVRRAHFAAQSRHLLIGRSSF